MRLGPAEPRTSFARMSWGWRSRALGVTKPIDDYIHRRTPCREVPAVQAGNLQRTPQTFRRGIDAPMSRSTRRLGQIGQDERIQFPDDVALKATMNFLVRHPLLCPALNVSSYHGIATHTHNGDRPQDIICGSVAAPVQALSDHLAI
jgi:hypothetical protein